MVLDETVEPAVVGVTVEGLWHLIQATKLELEYEIVG